jgi:cell division septation protein DedD
MGIAPVMICFEQSNRVVIKSGKDRTQEMGHDMRQDMIRNWLLAGGAALVLAGCQTGGGPLEPVDGAPSIAGDEISSATLDGEAAIEGEVAVEGASDTPVAEAATAPARSAKSVKLVDRDVEAPDVFQVTDEALWDGRPSLGGVWVASPDAVDPERVILRNPANGKFVIGALFKRERDNPGPTLQISSDAADALGLLAGQPGTISVTALRREEVPVAGPDANAPILDAAEAVQPGAEAADIAAGAAAAIEKSDDPAIPTAPIAEAKPAETAKAAAPASGSGSLIQIGIFSVEANATRAVEQLAKVGVAASISKESSQGKSFWSVTARGDKATLATIKSAGFADAYVLKR